MTRSDGGFPGRHRPLLGGVLLCPAVPVRCRGTSKRFTNALALARRRAPTKDLPGPAAVSSSPAVGRVGVGDEGPCGQLRLRKVRNDSFVWGPSAIVPALCLGPRWSAGRWPRKCNDGHLRLAGSRRPFALSATNENKKIIIAFAGTDLRHVRGGLRRKLFRAFLLVAHPKDVGVVNRSNRRPLLQPPRVPGRNPRPWMEHPAGR